MFRINWMHDKSVGNDRSIEKYMLLYVKCSVN